MGLVLIALQASPSLGAASARVSSGAIRFASDCPQKGTPALPIQEVCASDPVIPQVKTTYLDLLRQIYPDLRPDGNASQPPKETRTNLGQMDLSQGEAEPPTPANSSKNFFPAGDFTFINVGDAQGLRTVILESNSGTLAYFEIIPTVKLLDLVGISQDRLVSIASERGAYPIDARQFLFWTTNSHFNAGESFNIYNLIYAGTERINIAYDGPFLYGFALPNSDCNLNQSLAPVKLGAPNAAGFPQLTLTVIQEKLCQRGEKEAVTAARKFVATLNWDKAKGKYMGGSKELFLLNRCRLDGKPNCGF